MPDLKGRDFSRAVRFWVGRGFSHAVRSPSLLVAFSPRPIPTHQMPSLHIPRELMPPQMWRQIQRQIILHHLKWNDVPQINWHQRLKFRDLMHACNSICVRKGQRPTRAHHSALEFSLKAGQVTICIAPVAHQTVSSAVLTTVRLSTSFARLVIQPFSSRAQGIRSAGEFWMEHSAQWLGQFSRARLQI